MHRTLSITLSVQALVSHRCDMSMGYSRKCTLWYALC